MPSWHAAKSWSGRLPARSTPLPRQQLADAPRAFVGAGKGPVVSSDGDAAQRSFGGVVRDAQTAIGEEASERQPTFEAVVDCLGCLASSSSLLKNPSP